MQGLRNVGFFSFIILSLAFLPLPALAERQCNVPAGYYRVVDVENDGAVEFRAEPSHRSRLLAALGAGEIVQSDGTRSPGGDTTWQQVTILQTTGWVPARKLWRTVPRTLDASLVPATGRCGDSQPLWSMSWDKAKVRLSLFPGRYDAGIGKVTTSGNFSGTLVSGSGAGMSYRFIYDDDVCRNPGGEMVGMGRVHLIVSRGGGEQLYTGCCTALPEAFAKRPVPGQGAPD